MNRTDLQKKTKLQLWITMCEQDIITGDVSIYNMKKWTKQEMIDAIIAAEVKKDLEKTLKTEGV